jgi:hypothetical protein
MTADNGERVVLRGKCAGTRSEATVLFIGAVLDTSARYYSEFLKQMEEKVCLANLSLRPKIFYTLSTAMFALPHRTAHHYRWHPATRK